MHFRTLTPQCVLFPLVSSSFSMKLERGDSTSGKSGKSGGVRYLTGFAPMPPAPCFLWNGGYEAKWLRKSGSLAWLGAWETLGKRSTDPKLSSRSDQAGCLGAWGPGSKARKLAPGSFKIKPKWVQMPFDFPFETGAKFGN